MTATASPPSIDGLLERAERLERELLDLERQVAGAGAGTARAGLHLVLEAGGHRVLMEARTVLQIARVVEFTPIPGAPEAVLGGFVRRGRPAVGIDLARLLGVTREPELDAHLVIVGGVRLMGILVDRVQQVIESPMRVDPRAERLLPGFRADLVAGWCEVGGELLPLVLVETLERLATRPAETREDSRPPAGEGEST